ncbi:hypothetical protein C0J52_11319 [Blattella germanica]|nr:hypothetical protein C0J52_11319 [Blattella germanica]
MLRLVLNWFWYCLYDYLHMTFAPFYFKNTHLFLVKLKHLFCTFLIKILHLKFLALVIKLSQVKNHIQ